MAASCPLPVTPDLPTLRAKLHGLLRFLREALSISNAHTVDFYTESVWEQLVDLPPETVLAVLKRSAAEAEAQPSAARLLVEAQGGSDSTDFPKVFCETSQKLVSVEAFALAAKCYSVQNLGICTPLEQLLIALRGNQKQRTDKNVKPDEFMNLKKSHEVQAMSELISSVADYYGVKQIIDLGSGKGYLSSFLSLKYGLKVYGIDSSNTNTHGAEERNRKLKKHWRVYHRRSKLDVSALAWQTAKERKLQDEIECNAYAEGVGNSSTANQEKMSTSDFLPDFSGSVISSIRKQMENLHVHSHREENLYFENAFSVRDLLPINAIESTSSQTPKRKMLETNKERRKVTSKSNESNVYSPLTSFITADSELHDIIKDLEDCLMVGLHTCGDLAPNTLRIFAAKSEIKGVCSVGCCYHLLSEEFENPHKECTQEKWGFPMCHYLKEGRWCCGRNARMSACLALERVAVGQGLPTESLFYRAVLQDIIKDCYGITKCDRHVGKLYSKSSSFLDYVRKSLKKLGLDESKLPEKVIMDYYEKYKPRMNELEAFNMLKVVLAPCIETLILLDRLCYLKEQEDIAWSALVKLFDPVKSPRCYALIALKKPQ
ncbi:probable methyltransferase-like protein 25 isoform X1 [Phacochoerus africanus]|uniref:probable methyltransferase-like protein 25 isoform X1 n=1 Tax=Phacochoerus africanus TaxID=41426 RepID=UPI001FD8A20A|nr:probable methyltransferase-like protein 25 isoform X1 [Phacochoerus africanus]XP_047644305.1 probable methyltransferase-like protein 25 isoform X1 [Phacochoerus africanus]XP_047644306.1 probable methyltransferase-like protein 25 isoform X1 [Phacochoerus africanus]XP_047644307.1 probable methyltransferase-like protein 25 isoform X1 [Phacochoerus africanus]